MIFNDVYEYFSYRGLEDGYNKVMTEEEMYDYVANWPLPNLSCRKGTEDCYIFGFLLGMEIKDSELEEREERRKKREALETIRESSVRIRESQSRIDGLRDAVE